MELYMFSMMGDIQIWPHRYVDGDGTMMRLPMVIITTHRRVYVLVLYHGYTYQGNISIDRQEHPVMRARDGVCRREGVLSPGGAVLERHHQWRKHLTCRHISSCTCTGICVKIS
jgi:hypothetical protein